ncbi:related to dienelactone hydrolase [Phialocephala subalpina]|uniref:Related to dienelactone hydrolase n=1 Tax=Phialocephala subalpina TaxID=576137 RepID=A0A1L7XWZ4_9HELO|nr:related to dienelactone hydrolase [Phialocephala subalpina]
MGDSDVFLAKPSAACCLKGTIHEGEPRGCMTTISGIETYISKPPTEKANGYILLYFSDVWGLFNNGLLIMDGFSEAGYLVLGLDYFRGDPMWKHRKNRHDPSDPNFDYEGRKRKHTAFANKNVPRWIVEVKRQYCFGAPYVRDELAGDGVTAGAFGHPAFLKEHHFLNLKKPLFLSCSETDHTFDTKSRRRALDLLHNGNTPHQLQLFANVEHGFALRGNMENPYERYVKEQSLRGIIEWLDFWLSQ